jgi:ubiquinone/menaquinone biosynthesis C-methylase UbiE
MATKPPERGTDRTYYNLTPCQYVPGARAKIEAHAATVARFLDPIIPNLQTLGGRGHLDVLELGAGTCLTSLMIRKAIPQVRLTCLDISLMRMQALLEDSAKLVGTRHDGIELVEADIGEELPFENARFDAIVFDASLHHSCNIWTTLRECARVLRPDGAVAALREQYLAPLTAGYALDRLLRTHEVANGVSENAYLKEQYAYYFRANGFAPRFYPVVPTAKWRLLSPLNGIVFSKWSIWAERNEVER